MGESSNFAVLAEDFSPGYRDGAEPNRLPPGATPDARNAWFHTVSVEDPRRATMGRRPGTRLINPVAMSSGKNVDGLFEYRRTGADPALLAVCNGGLFQWDGIDTFTSVAAGLWTPGNRVCGCAFRENLFLVDGSANRRWNGVDDLPLGQVKPTGAPGLAAAAGPGVTGDYEGYAVWYDSVMDHESSPSATSATVTFANQTRRWTKPTGAPGAEYDFWRVYARRVDTNEFNFYRAATVAIGTATVDEIVSDTARRDIGPADNDNDPPAAAFAVLAEWKGYGIGIETASDEFVVSKQGDLQSWHPKNRFVIKRGSGDPITTAREYGEEFLLQKAHRSWRLQGDAVPFAIKPIHGSYGNVAHEAGLEVDGLYYGWDREKGPYRTDLLNWRSLNSGRISGILSTVTRAALASIRAIHLEEHRLILWAVPVDGSTRPRVLLPYHYELDTWLPPITGLEWAALSAFLDPTTDQTAVYAGDAWGRVFELFTGDREGVPTTDPMSTLTGTATAATVDTLTDALAAFYTTGQGLMGLPIAVVSPTGEWQWRRIASNTGTVITLDTTHDAPFSPTPEVGWTYYVGGIDWYQTTPVLDVGDPFTEKAIQHFYLEGRALSSSDALDVRVRVNGNPAKNATLSFTFQGGGAVWGVSQWGTAIWGAATRQPSKREVRQSVYAIQFELSNARPDRRFVATAWGLTADPKPRRRAA